MNNDECRCDFVTGLKELIHRKPNSRIVCLGQRIEGVPESVCVVPYEQSFGDQINQDGQWQGKLFNWDYSKEGD